MITSQVKRQHASFSLKVASRTNNLCWNLSNDQGEIQKSFVNAVGEFLGSTHMLENVQKLSRPLLGHTSTWLIQINQEPAGRLCTDSAEVTTSWRKTATLTCWSLRYFKFNQDTQAACTKVVHKHYEICLVSQTKHHKTFIKQLQIASCTNEESEHFCHLLSINKDDGDDIG